MTSLKVQTYTIHVEYEGVLRLDVDKALENICGPRCSSGYWFNSRPRVRDLQFSVGADKARGEQLVAMLGSGCKLRGVPIHALLLCDEEEFPEAPHL